MQAEGKGDFPREERLEPNLNEYCLQQGGRRGVSWSCGRTIHWPTNVREGDSSRGGRTFEGQGVGQFRPERAAHFILKNSSDIFQEMRSSGVFLRVIRTWELSDRNVGEKKAVKLERSCL